MSVFKIGDKVTYMKGSNFQQNGIIKDIKDLGRVYVVYHCNNSWKNYNNYTAQLTNACNLSHGWN